MTAPNLPRGGSRLRFWRYLRMLLTVLAPVAAATFVLANLQASPAAAAPGTPNNCGVFYDDALWEIGDEPNPALVVSWNAPAGVQGVVYLNGAQWLTRPAGVDEARILNMALNRTTHVSVAFRDASGQSSRRYCGYIYTSPNASTTNAPALPTPNTCSVARIGNSIRFSIQGADYISKWRIRDNGQVQNTQLFSSRFARSLLTDTPIGNRAGVHHFSIRATGFQKDSGWRYCGQVAFNDTPMPARPASCSVSGTSFIQWARSNFASSYDLWVNGNRVRTVGENVTSQNMPRPGNGPTWHFSVSARNANGASSRTYCGSYTDRAAPPAPGWCTVVQSGPNFLVRHQNVGADSYSVRINGSESIQPNGGGVTWASSPGTVPIFAVQGTAHVSVRSVNNIANGASSATYCGSVNVNLGGNSPPARPGSCSLTRYSSGVQLNWSGVSDAGYYEVFRGGTRLTHQAGTSKWVPASQLQGIHTLTVRSGTASRGASANTTCGTVTF